MERKAFVDEVCASSDFLYCVPSLVLTDKGERHISSPPSSKMKLQDYSIQKDLTVFCETDRQYVYFLRPTCFLRHCSVHPYPRRLYLRLWSERRAGECRPQRVSND